MNPCVKCGSTERDVKTNRCIRCKREYNSNFYIKHKDRVTQRVKQWSIDNSEKRKEITKNWLSKNSDYARNYFANYRESNRVACRSAKNDWQSKNKDRAQASNVRRKALKIKATPLWANTFFIYEIYNLAKIRSDSTGIKWHVDHIVPLRSKLVCGLHVENNLQVIPASENLAKSNVIWPNKP